MISYTVYKLWKICICMTKWPAGFATEFERAYLYWRGHLVFYSLKVPKNVWMIIWKVWVVLLDVSANDKPSWVVFLLTLDDKLPSTCWLLILFLLLANSQMIACCRSLVQYWSICFIIYWFQLPEFMSLEKNVSLRQKKYHLTFFQSFLFSNICQCSKILSTSFFAAYNSKTRFRVSTVHIFLITMPSSVKIMWLDQNKGSVLCSQ